MKTSLEYNEVIALVDKAVETGQLVAAVEILKACLKQVVESYEDLLSRIEE